MRKKIKLKAYKYMKRMILIVFLVSICFNTFATPIKIKIENWIDSTDPSKTVSIEGNFISNQIFETLITNGPNGDYLPLLASTWIFSPDGKSLTMKLNSHAKFSDGSQVTSKDVERMIESSLRADIVQSTPKIVGAKDFASGKRKNVSGFEIISSNEFKINFEVPNYGIIRDLADVHCAIFSRKNNESLIGTGPYIISKIDEDKKELLLIPNLNYWSQKKSSLSFHISSSTNFDGDIIFGINRFDPKEFDLVEYFDSEVYFMGFNSESKILKELDARKHLSTIISNKDIKDVTNAQPAHGGVIPIGISGYTPNLQQEVLLNAESKTKLANHIKGQVISVLTYQARLERIANLFCERLSRLGAVCKLERVTFLDLFKRRDQGKLQIFFARLKPTIPDAEDILGNFTSGSYMNIYLPKAKSNVQNTLNEDFKNLQNLPITSREQRNLIIKKMDSLIVDQFLVRPFFYGGQKSIQIRKYITLPILNTLGPLGLKLIDVTTRKDI